MSRSKQPSLHRYASILSAVLVGGVTACSSPIAPTPSSDPTEEAVRELVLRTTTLTVNKMVESEVVIRFEPSNGLTITDLCFRLDNGAWNTMKDPSAGWHIKSDRLTLGDHTVEMRALANGKRPISGLMVLKVYAEDAQETSWGSGTTSNVRIVI